VIVLVVVYSVHRAGSVVTWTIQAAVQPVVEEANGYYARHLRMALTAEWLTGVVPPGREVGRCRSPAAPAAGLPCHLSREDDHISSKAAVPFRYLLAIPLS
jgi:hypothetical protein